MQTIEQTIFNKLPKQKKPTKSSFKFQVKAIDNWFDTLPLANIRIATKSIYQILKETNSQVAPYKNRLYFLEKIHKPITELADNLKKLNLNRGLPLNEKHARIAILISKLHNQISIGYKLVLRDLVNCKLFFLCPGKGKLMAQVTERIIRHHSLSLIASYQFYSPHTKGLWLEIHHLFLFSQNKKLQAKKVIDPSLSLKDVTTINNVYLQILLVSIADPYHMAQHHTYSIFKQLEEWSALAEIHPYDDSEGKASLVIDLSKDSMPSFIAPQDVDDPKNIWTLNTSKLDYAHLIDHFQGPQTQTTEINVELLKQLSLSWGIAPSRQHSRRPTKAKLKVAIGLNNVHYVLNGNSEPDWAQESADNEGDVLVLSEHNPASVGFNARTVESTVKISDIWGEVFQNKSLSPEDGSDDASDDNSGNKNGNSQQAKDPKEAQEWKMVNESIGGYCLLWDQGDSIQARVGELIAISHEVEKKDGSWFVGTIRWLKCTETEKVQIGVQIIAPNAIAVSTAKFVSMQEGMKSRAITLPAIPILKQPKTLITTALGYEVRDQVMLDEYRLINSNITTVKTKVVLLDTLELSSHFSRFKYTLAEDFYGTSQKKETLQKNQDDTLSLDNDTDFDSIWDDL
ncbi:MAG: hypothetical protein GY694_14225 [Gammaproteobacteria bacterium]|nr:hypothetical protein [Gammaproteobacteria bacterium]